MTQNELVLIALKTEERGFKLKIEQDKNKLDSNYCYWFAWVGEDIWLNSYKYEFCKSIIQQIEDGDELQTAILERRINQLERYVSDVHNVRQNSTGSLFRECSTWQFIASMHLLSFLKSLIKF
jgi:hypothetical protein